MVDLYKSSTSVPIEWLLFIWSRHRDVNTTTKYDIYSAFLVLFALASKMQNRCSEPTDDLTL